MPFISVVVPVYNIGDRLSYCLDSLLLQSYQDFEVLLIDDGSSDNSPVICDGYCVKDDRVRVIHKDNEGVSVARNTGIGHARGEYIFFVDCDDYVEQDYLSSFVRCMEDYPGYENIWCGFRTVSDYNKSVIENVCYDSGTELSFSSRLEIMTLHEKWLDASVCNKAFKRAVLNEYGIRMEKGLSLGEDLLFNFQYLDALENDKILVINRPLYNYTRIGSESLDNKYYPDMLGIYSHVNAGMLRYLQKWDVNAGELKKYNRACFYKMEAVLKNTFHQSNKSSLWKKLRYNGKIMRSGLFREYFRQIKEELHPIYRIAYSSGFYPLVMLAGKAGALKNRRMG